jgi:hypothetical protein
VLMTSSLHCRLGLGQIYLTMSHDTNIRSPTSQSDQRLHLPSLTLPLICRTPLHCQCGHYQPLGPTTQVDTFPRPSTLESQRLDFFHIRSYCSPCSPPQYSSLVRVRSRVKTISTKLSQNCPSSSTLDRLHAPTPTLPFLPCSKHPRFSICDLTGCRAPPLSTTGSMLRLHTFRSWHHAGTDALAQGISLAQTPWIQTP